MHAAAESPAPRTPLRLLAAAARVLLVVLATLVLGCALVLLVIERSGWLATWVRAGLAETLGEPLTIRTASLSWTDAAIEVEGLSLGAVKG